MNDLRKAAQQALEALEVGDQFDPGLARVVLRAALAQPDVPQGWVLVPVEPTPEMLAAAHDAIQLEGLTTTTWLRTTCYRAMLAAAPKGGTAPDGLPRVVSGAIFDFAGYLTTRPEAIEVGATANAAPIADLVMEWAKLRGLSLDEPAVLSWQDWLPKAPKGGA